MNQKDMQSSQSFNRKKKVLKTNCGKKNLKEEKKERNED